MTEVASPAARVLATKIVKLFEGKEGPECMAALVLAFSSAIMASGASKEWKLGAADLFANQAKRVMGLMERSEVN